MLASKPPKWIARWLGGIFVVLYPSWAALHWIIGDVITDYRSLAGVHEVAFRSAPGVWTPISTHLYRLNQIHEALSIGVGIVLVASLLWWWGTRDR